MEMRRMWPLPLVCEPPGLIDEVALFSERRCCRSDWPLEEQPALNPSPCGCCHGGAPGPCCGAERCHAGGAATVIREGRRTAAAGEEDGCRVRKMRGKGKKREREESREGMVGVASFAVVSSENSFRICARLIALPHTLACARAQVALALHGNHHGNKMYRT